MERPAIPISARQVISFVLGVILFFVVLFMPAPAGMSVEAKRVAAMIVLMACWWIGEAIPVGITALVPLVVLPLMGVMSADEASAPYADNTIFLFLGGFFIAMAMQKWNLHKRIALKVIKMVGFRPRRIVLGIMIATAGISMWMSNTATALMMIPIAIALLTHFKEEKDSGELLANLGPALALGVAYAATIGGMGTLVGTPPNIVLVKVAKEVGPGYNVSFLGWMVAAFPFVAILTPLTWFFLTRVSYHVPATCGSGEEVIDVELKKLGPMSRNEKTVLGLFMVTAVLWLTRAGISQFHYPGWAAIFPNPKYVTDATVAMTTSFLLFLIPADWEKGDFLLDIEWVLKIPWDVVLLLGGGFSLAHAVSASGFGDWIGGAFEPMSKLPTVVVVGVLSLVIVFANEVMSNTAMATLSLPILGAVAVKNGIHPLMLMLPAALASSLGFMLPSGTPPNAIAVATGSVNATQMARTGFILNILSVALLTIIVPLITLPLLVSK